MGGFIVQVDDKMVTMPFDVDWMVDTLEGRFPNQVMLTMDEDRFQSDFAERAEWTHGHGEYATLAYCGHGLTIMRHLTLEEAIQAKRTIDGGGCGGGCCKIHVIVKIDSTNSRKARELENVRAYLASKKDENS